MKNDLFKGILYTLAGGICWGFCGVCSQYLFSHTQADPFWLTCVRLLGAGLLLTVLACKRMGRAAFAPFSSPKNCLKMLIFSILGLAFCQFTYLKAIRCSNAATATILQYLAPVAIMLISCTMLRRLPRLSEFAALILAVSGTFLLVTHGDPGAMVLTKQGLFWGLTSAVALVLYTMLPEGLIAKYGTLCVTGTGMLLGGLVLGIGGRFWRFYANVGVGGAFAVAAIVLIGTALSFTLYLTGVKLIGSVRASMVSSIEPVSSVVFSVLWLNSRFEIMDFAGFACILCTVFLLAFAKAKNS